MIPIRMPNDCTEDKTKVTTSRKEVAIQTGGILTVRQRSTQNYIPKGSHQLRRSAQDRKRQDHNASKKENSGMEINIEVRHNNEKVSITIL